MSLDLKNKFVRQWNKNTDSINKFTCYIQSCDYAVGITFIQMTKVFEFAICILGCNSGKPLCIIRIE